MKTFIILALFYTVISSQDIKSPCSFNHDKRTYFCTKIKNAFPNMFYGSYHLKCTECEIPVFGPKTFPVQAELHSFNVSNSGIQEISAGAFAVLPYLQYLYLQDNVIYNIIPNAFNNLRHLYELNLENNKLVKLTPGLFRGLQADSVTLCNNKIVDIPPKVFEGVLGILAFNFSYNQIGILDVESFYGLNDIEILDLKYNKICYIPLGIFKNVQKLRILDLSGNNLRSLPPGTLSGLKSLITLNLADNKLVEFISSSLLSTRRLSSLDISRNGIHYLDAQDLHSYAPTIRALSISDNIWECTILINLIRFCNTVNIDTSDITIDRYEVTNINGIACSMDAISDYITFEKFLEVVAISTKKKLVVVC